MAFVLLLCATFLTALAIWWGTRRRRETAAWNRELDAAFDVGERPEILRRPVL